MSEAKKLDENYVLSLRQWAELIAVDQVVTTKVSMARVVLELLGHVEAMKRERQLQDADTGSLILAGIEMRKNLSPFVGSAIGSALYRWDEVVKQTTAIGAVELLRKAEMARELVTKVNGLEADLTFGVFPGWRSYEEWVAAGRPFETEKANGPG